MHNALPRKRHLERSFDGQPLRGHGECRNHEVRLREAELLGIELSGVRVTAAGGFDTTTWQSTGIDYSVEVSSDASADKLAHLLEAVDQVAEIPQAIRADASVRRAS